MRSLPMCAAWLILTGVSVALQSVRTNPLEILILMFLTIYGIQAFIAEALGVRVSKKSISFPRRLIPSFPFLRIVAHAHQMRRHRPDKFAAQGAGSRAKEHRRAPAGEFPKSRGAAAIFSICQKSGPFDQHIPLTRDFGRPAFPSPAKARILWRRRVVGALELVPRGACSEHFDFARFPVARTIPSERKSRQGERHVSCFSRARRACRRVAGVGL